MIKSENQTKADPEILKIASEYVRRLEEKQVPLTQVILYGSQARGSAVIDSDIDILVVVDFLDKWVYKAIVDEAFEVNLHFGVDLIAVPCDRQEYELPLFRADHFYKNINLDGIILR
ncbi:MAG: nucleotidyltransferase domain-containing protein [Firmicutes bacterium]|nr:nucleotidyltransferase domain-containing protein [Bacillota bacterium]